MSGNVFNEFASVQAVREHDRANPIGLPPMEQVTPPAAPPAAPPAPSSINPDQTFGDTRRPAPTTGTAGPPPDLLPLFDAAAAQHGVPYNVLMAIAEQESGYNPRAVGTPTQWGRARGLMQYLDSTAQGLGINPYDPAQAIEGAARQIRQRLDAGASMEDAIREHFAGPDRRLWGPKTQRYGEEVVARALRLADRFGDRGGAPPPAPEAVAPTDPGAAAPGRRLATAQDYGLEPVLTDDGGTAPPPDVSRYAGMSVRDRAGQQIRSGWESLRQSMLAIPIPAVVGQLEDLDAIEAERDPSKLTPRQRRLAADLDRPEDRAAYREEMLGRAASLWGPIIASRARQAEFASHPAGQAIVEAGNAGRWGDVWRMLRADPGGLIQQFTVESLPASAAMMAPAIGAAAAGAGRVAQGVTTYFSSYGMEFGGQFLEAVTEGLKNQGVDVSNARAVSEALNTHREAVQAAIGEARRGANGPAILDAFAMGFARGLRPGSSAAANVGRVATNLGVETATEPAGDALGQVFARGEVDKPGELVPAALGGLGQAAGTTTAATIQEARHARTLQPGALPSSAPFPLASPEPAPGPAPTGTATPPDTPPPAAAEAPPAAPDSAPAGPAAEPAPPGPLTRALAQQEATSMNAGASVMIEAEGLDPIPGTVEYETPEGVMVRTEEGSLLVSIEDIRSGQARVVPVAAPDAPGAPVAEGSEPAAVPGASEAVPQAAAPQPATSQATAGPPGAVPEMAEATVEPPAAAAVEAGEPAAPAEAAPIPSAPAVPMTAAEAWPLVQAGGTERAGAPADVLVAARAAREAGGLNDQKQFRAFLADWNRSVAAAGLDPRTEEGNIAAMAVIRRHAITPEEFAARSRAQAAREADAADIDLGTATEDQLRGRLRHLARQAKAASGPPGKALVAERKRVEAAIDRLAAPPPTAPRRATEKPARVPRAIPPPAAATDATPAPAPKPRPKQSKAAETGHAKRARATLGGAADGDVIQASAAVGYMAPDTPMRVTSIGKNGTVYVENIATGSGTSLSRGEMEGARQRGVRFSWVEPPATQDTPAVPLAPTATPGARPKPKPRTNMADRSAAFARSEDKKNARFVRDMEKHAQQQSKRSEAFWDKSNAEAEQRAKDWSGKLTSAVEQGMEEGGRRPAEAPQPPADTNTIFTADAAEAARKVLRAKLAPEPARPSTDDAQFGRKAEGAQTEAAEAAPDADIGEVRASNPDTPRRPLRLGAAIIGHDLGVGRNHPDYAAAKAGDVEAAVRLARDLVTDQIIERAREAIGRRKPIVVPVVSIEASGRNKIPLAVSRLLALRLGLPAGNDIVQANAPRRTALSGLDRVFAQPVFDGPVEAGRDYLILDDTLTQGGTFAALASHIEAGGGQVIAAIALTGKDYSAKLGLSPETLSELREKFGDVEPDFRAAAGHGFDALTESEARYLVRFRPAQAVRDRIVEGGRQGRERADRQASRPPGVGDPSAAIPAGWGEAETSNDDPDLTPEALAALGDILRVIAGPEAVLEQGRTGNAEGIAAGPLVRLSMSLGEDRANWVTGHEAIHTLRNLGRITPAEWAILTDAAAREGWGERFGTERRYRNRDPDVRAEEAVAEAFAAWATGNLDGRGPVARIFQRIKAFLQRLRNAMAGRGFKDRQSIFQAIRRGEMGRRAPGSAGPTRLGTATNEQIGAELDRRVDAGVFTQDKNGLIHLALPPEQRAEQDGKLRAFVRDTVERARPAMLATMPLRPLLEEVASYLPSAARFLRTKQAMDAMRAQWFATSADLSNKWLRFRSRDKTSNVALMDLMHASTLAGIDPSAPIQDGADAETKARHDALRQQYEALPAAGQALYAEVRDTYSKLADAFDAALMENVSAAVMVAARDAERDHRREMARIDASEAMSPDEKQTARAKADKALKRVQTVTKMNRGARMQKLRQQFEANRLPGPYFPLARFGEFFVTARDKAGKVVSYSLFEWPGQQRAFARQMEAEGYTVTMDRVSNDKGGLRSQVDPRFVAEVEGLLANANVPADLQDAIWQRFLQRMPDMSIRTSRIHRKGTAGFTKDAIRAFGHHMFHGSHQLARLNYAMELQDHLANAREEAQDSKRPNAAVAVVNEMANRLDFIMNPTGAAWSHMLTSAGFVYFLSASPAAALVNLTQTAVVGVPVLAASKGGSVGRATTQLARALKDVGSGFSAKEWRSGFVSATRAKSLTPDERSLMREIYEIGLADGTQAHDLAGVAESGVAYSNARHKVMSVISYGFHHAERMNREATALAAYRMQRAAGMDHAAAVEEANRLTWKIHFDYSNTSRPRAMQGDWRKVVLLFRNFTVNMLFRLFRDTHQMLRGETAEVRREARMQLVGMTMMMAATAGIRGVWGYGIAMTLAGLFFGAGEDEEDELRKWMQRNLGVTAAGILLDGLPGYGLGISLSERVGMPDLWFRSSDRLLEGEKAFHDLWGQLFGPVLYGIPRNVWRGTSMALDGLRETGEWREVFRGVETAMPKGIRDLMRAGRFAKEGALTMRGEALLESVPAADVFKQAMGFTPARLAEIYGQNNSLQNAQRAISDQRTKIMNGYYRAIRADDLDEMRRLEARVQRFNEEHPENAITPRSLRQSIRTRARNSAQTVNGVRLPPRQDGPLRARLPERTYN